MRTPSREVKDQLVPSLLVSPPPGHRDKEFLFREISALVVYPSPSTTITFSNVSGKTRGKTRATISSFEQRLSEIPCGFPWQS